MTNQVIVNGFRQDEVGDWVMELSCGHRQHVRHHPPFINRPWVQTDEGRRQHLDMVVTCTQCQRGMPVPE
ncbi:DUF3565 domain-containing protein [Alcanivorax sp. DP30]|uniref:DUF3565 domain-containing protein n=1 Tax=Alcanivorax sp. DP30 TaxID=2606217 RepID=UPI001370A316|nr:DUF3565 domain-containing protein [Alcanivorax sp. DP30]MZR63965.1 DUF3565 domain-containing protein [Alcanivorax sp. DP30]